MNVTLTLTFLFLLQFFSHTIVHFVFGNICLSAMLPPKSQTRFGLLVLNPKRISLATILQLWISQRLSSKLYKAEIPIPLPCKGVLRNANPCHFKFIFLLSQAAKAGRELCSLCSEGTKLLLQRGNFPMLAQRAEHRFISYKRESTGRATLIGISPSPLNAEEGQWAKRQAARRKSHLGSKELFRTHPETGSDEISSHMNREAVMHPHPLPVLTGVRGGWWGESRTWGSRLWGEGRRDWWEAVGKVPVLSLTPVPSSFWDRLSKLVSFILNPSLWKTAEFHYTLLCSLLLTMLTEQSTHYCLPLLRVKYRLTCISGFTLCPL